LGGGYGFDLGHTVADRMGWRRKRNLFSTDSNSNQFSCELLHQAFLSSDRNQDGRLSIEEFGFTTDQSVQLLKNLDLDNSAFIEPNELNPCLAHLNHPQIKEGHRRGRRFAFSINGQTVYSDNGWTTAQSDECDENSGIAMPTYYVPSQQVIYI
jgi:hypothetical protein